MLNLCWPKNRNPNISEEMGVVFTISVVHFINDKTGFTWFTSVTKVRTHTPRRCCDVEVTSQQRRVPNGLPIVPKIAV